MGDATEEKAPAAVPAPPGMPMKMIIIVGGVALLMGLGGAFAMLKLAGGGGHGGGEDQKTEAASPKQGGGHGESAPKPASGAHAPGAIFDLDPFIVNLADAPEIRYLKLTVKLEVDGADPATELGPRVPQIRDTILVLLTSKDSATVKSPQGKFQLRDEITQRINSLLSRPVIRTAYFTEFVVQ